jgi:hypothetical protein
LNIFACGKEEEGEGRGRGERVCLREKEGLKRKRGIGVYDSSIGVYLKDRSIPCVSYFYIIYCISIVLQLVI